MSSATLSRYSQHDTESLTDELAYRRSQLREHYQECGTCYLLAQSGGRERYDSEGCSTAQQLAEVVIDLDLEVGHWPAIHRYGLSWFYANSYGFHAHEPITEAMGTVVTASERPVDRWDIEPDVCDDWTAEDVLRAARQPLSSTPDAEQEAARAQHLVSSAIWNAETPWELFTLTADVDVEGLLKAHARIWTTPRGEVGIYKTFISQVTESTFTAYCSVCRKRLVMERSLRNVIATILHAHSHLPNSVIRGDTQDEDPYLTLEGSEATPLPGESRNADLEFVRKAGQWYVDSAFLERREHGTPIDEVVQEWTWLTYSANVR